MSYYNPFSLLFERDTNEFSIHNTIPLPETSNTPIENTKANLSKTQLSKDTVGSPVCSPLSSLDSVLSWRPGLDDMAVSHVPLNPRIPDQFENPSVLLCHDMLGGYNKDQFVQGHTSLDDYYFYHWQQISIFNYFSHHFVTIPPSCWTNAAHRHGVLSLGTVITEWQDGVKLCNLLLRDESTALRFADQLISIAEYYGFDGWLINIENPIHRSQMNNLYIMLTVLVTGIHQRIPGSKVIWYDSVTTDGELKWQNKVNEKNEYFFSLCDGIFLNYHWKRQFLADTQMMVGNGRSKDVFVGIDVFGRGTFGGGGFNCSIAMDVIKDYNLSMAVFAPGWVYETLDKKQFFTNQDRFWQLLSSFQSPFPPVSCLPLVSSFSRGCGSNVAVDGKLHHRGPWTNLSVQDLQLTFPECLYINDTKSSIQLKSVTIDSSNDINPYSNGSVLLINGTVLSNNADRNRPANIRLFKCNIPVTEGIIVSYTYDCTMAANIAHCMRLRTSENDKFVLLRPNQYESTETIQIQNARIVDSLTCKDQEIVHSLFTGEGNMSDSWKTSYYIIKGSNTMIIKGISLCLLQGQNIHRNEDFALKIGEIKLCDQNIFKTELQNVFNIRITSTTMHSLTISWDHNHPITNIDPVEYFNIYLKVNDTFNFVGRSFNNMFHLPIMAIQKSTNSLNAFIQPVTVSRRKIAIALNSSIDIVL